MPNVFTKPWWFVLNRFETRGSESIFVHTDRSLVIGLLTGIVVWGYGSNLVNLTSEILAGTSISKVGFDLLLATASIAVFSPVFVRSLLLSKRFSTSPGVLVLHDFWPVSFLQTRLEINTVEHVTLTTLFSHLSKKATLYLAVHTRAGRHVKQVYTCARSDLNGLVQQLGDLLRAADIEVRVSNENQP